jgi:hypothetical protein
VFHRENTVLRAGTGIAVPNATITIYVNGTDTAGDYTNATLAPVFAGKDDIVPIAGSVLTSDGNGRYSYFVASGIYDERLRYGAIDEVDQYLQLYDLAGANASAVAAASSAATSAATATSKAAEAAAASTATVANASTAAGSAAAAAASATTAATARDQAVTASNAATTSKNAAETSRSAAAVSEANAAASAAAAAASAAGGGGGGGGVTTNALTISNDGAGAVAGSTFNGSAARKISYNSIGAQQASGMLQALANLAWTAGAQIPVLNGPSSFALRSIGSATAADILDRSEGDARYQPVGTYLTQNQIITVDGDVTGSGRTGITLLIGANKVTRGMLAQAAGATILGATAAGNVTDLTAAQAKTFLAIAAADVSGLGAIATSGSGADLTNGTVTLAKQANVAAGTVFYRKSTGSGAPEVQSLATLKTDLGLIGTNTGDQQATAQADSTASTLSQLVTDFNALLAKMRTANLIATPSAPVNSVAPAVTGTAAVGNTLTGTDGTWTNSPTAYSRQWYTNTVATTSGGTPISGETLSTLSEDSTKSGKYIYFGVKAYNGPLVSAEAFSNIVGPIAAGSAPTFTRTGTVGASPFTGTFSAPNNETGDYFYYEFSTASTKHGDGSGRYATTTQSGTVKITGEITGNNDLPAGFSAPAGNFWFHFQMLRDNDSGLTSRPGPSGDTGTYDASPFCADYNEAINVSVAHFSTTQKPTFVTISGADLLTMLVTGNVGTALCVPMTVNAQNTKFTMEMTLVANAAAGGSAIGFYDPSQASPPDFTSALPFLPGAAGSSFNGCFFQALIGGTTVGYGRNGASGGSNNFAVSQTLAAGDILHVEVDTTLTNPQVVCKALDASNSYAVIGTTTLVLASLKPAVWGAFGRVTRGASGLNDTLTINAGASPWALTPAAGFDNYYG